MNNSAKPTKACPAYLMCDGCGHGPIVPMHGHFVCPECLMPTKCCEGAPAE